MCISVGRGPFKKLMGFLLLKKVMYGIVQYWLHRSNEKNMRRLRCTAVLLCELVTHASFNVFSHFFVKCMSVHRRFKVVQPQVN